MGVMDSLVGIARDVLTTTGAVVKGAELARQWIHCKPERAQAQWIEEIPLIVARNDRAQLSGILQEFGRQLVAAETLELQNETNQLLSQFKECLNTELAPLGVTLRGFLQGATHGATRNNAVA